MSTGRANGCHYCPRRVTAAALALGVMAMLATGGCRRGVPVVDGGSNPVARGTLTGVVRGTAGSPPVVDREVEIVNAETGARQTTQTGAHGGFTIQLPAGKYRIELSLREGETLVKRPGVIDLGNGDVDSHIELVLGAVRASRPRGPAYRLDNGLGAPIT